MTNKSSFLRRGLIGHGVAVLVFNAGLIASSSLRLAS